MKYVNEEEGEREKRALAMTALCEIAASVVCQEWEEAAGGVYAAHQSPAFDPTSCRDDRGCSSANQCVSNPGDPEGALLRVEPGKHLATPRLRAARSTRVKRPVDTPAAFAEAARAIVYWSERHARRGLAPSQVGFPERVVRAADARSV